jgi:hypothetical protein
LEGARRLLEALGAGARLWAGFIVLRSHSEALLSMAVAWVAFTMLA